MTILTSKAAWLTLVCGSRLSRYVPRFSVITAKDWRAQSHVCLRRIQQQFAGAQLAVRSSKHNETAGLPGQAGRYRSFGPIDAANRVALSRAVKAVFESYSGCHEADEVLLQLWVAGSVATLGVSSADSTPFGGTATLSYYVGESTSAITAGWTNVQRFWLTENTPPPKRWPSAVRRAFVLLAALEATLGRTAFDLEIAVDEQARLRLLQVTPSTRMSGEPRARVATALQEKRWAQAEREFDKHAHPRAGALGRKPLFGLMPDWNTAELLGEHPRPLAASLFEALIANNAWRQARINLGYRRSAIQPLLGFIAGRPCVDVRASLNSLIPEGISDAVSRQVVEASINTLKRHPELHDRAETQLFPTCVGFAHEGRAQLSDAGLGNAEQRVWCTALLAMEPTWQAFSTRAAACDDIENPVLNGIDEWRSGEPSATNMLRALRLIRCRLALPFAMHARLAFVARFQLASLVSQGAIRQNRIDKILGGVAVINSADGLIARDAGVLRPATFDIRVPPVGHRSVNPISTHTNIAASTKRAASVAMFTTQEDRAVATLLKPLQLDGDANQWLQMTLRRIELRERYKYRLSIAVSRWLLTLTDWGKRRDLSVDDLSFVTIRSVAGKHEPKELARLIARNRNRYEDEALIKMPLLLAHRADIRAHAEPAMRPTFAGRGLLAGPLTVIDRHTRAHDIALGTVVLTRAADPGFDWIFAHPLAALVTCYGGPHSHMAVRCAELNIPCVLGCGEAVYNALSAAPSVTVDFDLAHVRVNA